MFYRGKEYKGCAVIYENFIKNQCSKPEFYVFWGDEFKRIRGNFVGYQVRFDGELEQVRFDQKIDVIITNIFNF